MQYLPVLLVFLFSASPSIALTGFSNAASIQRRMMGTRSALIFSSEWESSRRVESIKSNVYFNNYSQESFPRKQLAESITQSFVASLARLAVVFSPPERTLRLSDIERVQVLDMDENHLDIEAVLCEGEECITLSVPVSFPSPCATDSSLGDLSECILANINALDFEAAKVVKKLRQENENFEETIAQERHLAGMKRSQDLDLPLWWISPSGELVAECAFLKKLLNEDDFSKDLRSLACRTMSDILGEHFEVQQAVVAIIGPAGLVIRASYVEESLFGRSHIDLGSTELPISFKTAARNVSELRELILRTVEA